MIPRRRSKRRRRKGEEDVGLPSEMRAPGYGLRMRLSNDYCILHSTTGKLSPPRVPGCEGKNVTLYKYVPNKNQRGQSIGLDVFVGLRETDAFSLLKVRGEDERGGNINMYDTVISHTKTISRHPAMSQDARVYSRTYTVLPPKMHWICDTVECSHKRLFVDNQHPGRYLYNDQHPHPDTCSLDSLPLLCFLLFFMFSALSHSGVQLSVH